jgi:hypothetical protein
MTGVNNTPLSSRVALGAGTNHISNGKWPSVNQNLSSLLSQTSSFPKAVLENYFLSDLRATPYK